MDRWSFNVDACFNVFMTVAYDADGKWEIRPPKGKPGDYMTLRALMPQIVAISNCPVLFNACNDFRSQTADAGDFEVALSIFAGVIARLDRAIQ